MKQRTLAREVSITGNALHTGEAVTLTMKPAPADHGILFHAPENIVKQFPQFPAVNDYASFFDLIRARM